MCKFRLLHRMSLTLSIMLSYLLVAEKIQAQYCNSSFGNINYEHVTNVTFAGINNTTGGITGYNDYTAQVANVSVGGSYNLSSTILFDPNGGDYVYAFIDWDQNNVLNDLGEVYILASNVASGGPFVLNVTVPVAAVPGNTRMRVMVDWNNGTPDPCRVATYGEVEDYTVNVSAAPCIAPPTAGTAIANPNPVCFGLPYTVSLQGTSTGVGLTYQWESSPNNSVWTAIPLATGSSYSTNMNGNVWYRCIVTCSGQSDTSASVQAQQESFINCYCTPSTTFGCGIDYIANVTFGNINNSTGCGSTYNDFTSMQTTVFLGSNAALSVTTDGDDEGVGVWIDYDHSGTFDPSEFVLSGYTGNQPETYTTSVAIPNNAMTGPTRMRVRCKYANTVYDYEECSNFNYGEIEDYIVIIAPLPQNDAGVASIANPVLPACNLNDTLIVALTNIGVLPLTSGNLNVQVNNAPPAVVPFTVNIPSGQTANLNLGMYNFNDGDVLKLWTDNPNGVQDSFAFNDTLIVTLYQALSGIYTIGGVAPDYVTFADARNDLELRGICGDVFMNIRSGLYTEQIDIHSIAGTNPFRVYFQSETGVVTDVIMQNNAFMTDNNYVFYLEDADYLTFRNITFDYASTAYTNGIVVISSDSVIIENNHFHSDSLFNFDADNYDQIPINTIINGNSFVFGASKDLVIRGNKIWGGARGILAYEDFQNNFITGLSITDNEFYGIQNPVSIFGQKSPVISRNKMILSPNSSAFSAGIFARGVIEGAVFEENNIIDTASGAGYGIMLALTVGTVAHPMQINNNFILIEDPFGYDNQGIMIRDDAFGPSGLFNIYHNNIYVNGTDACNGIYIQQSNYNNNATLYNNIIQTGDDAYVMNVENSVGLSVSDNNNFFGNNNFIQFQGTDYATLSAFQALGFDGNSMSYDPLFNLGANDLHTCRVEFDGAAMDLNFANDIDGDQRHPSTPDIGADEFIGAAPIDLGPDTIICFGDAVPFGVEFNNAADYLWIPLNDTNNTVMGSAPGVYILTVTSACGTQTDSVTLNIVPAPQATFTTVVNFYTVITTNNSTGATSYHWDFGDGNTSTLSDPVHVYAANGTYNITLTAYNDCGDSSVFVRTVMINVQYVGIEEEIISSLNLYPNPATEVVNVAINYPYDEELTILVTDISGRRVLATSAQGNFGALTIPVNVSDFAPGTYFFTISGKDFEEVRKVIKH